MLKFAISTEVKLGQKPSWLEPFREKYHQMYEYHVTLKQTCFIEEEKIQEVKKRFTDFMKSLDLSEGITMKFDRLIVEPETNGQLTIMILAAENQAISELQKELLHLFQDETRYCLPESKSWEQNFRPHITIAADLDRSVYEQARHEIGEDVYCEGAITAVLLLIDDQGVVERIAYPIT